MGDRTGSMTRSERFDLKLSVFRGEDFECD
jgi:hypothetical protein